jgi:hypothetical protein
MATPAMTNTEKELQETEVAPGIRDVYKPSEKQLNILKHVYRRFYQIRDSSKRGKLIAHWDSAIKNWEAFRPEKKEKDWQSNYFIPLTTSVVESVLSEMVDQTPRPIILPRSLEDQPKATAMQHIFNFTWEVSDGDIELYKWMKNTLIFGTGITQEYFWQDARNILIPDKMGKDGKIVYKEKMMLEHDDSFMENVSLYDIYVDEKARDVNRGPYKARDVIRRYVMDVHVFRDFFKGKVWDPFNNARFVKGGGRDTNYYEFFNPPETEFKHTDVEVLWYWGRRPDDALHIVANDVLIVAGPNYYRHKQLPFARAIDVMRPNQFYGKGEPELLESMQAEMNMIRRMWSDRSRLDLDKMFLVSNRETLNDRDLIARPHGMIPVDDPKSVKPVEYGDIPRSVQIHAEEVNRDAIKVTGVEDRFQSAQSPSTATEAAILKESVLRRVRMKLRMFEKGALVDVGRMRVSNIMQFYSTPKIEKILGETDSKGFRKAVSKANREGRLVVNKGVAFEKKFKEIRIPGKRLITGEDGKLKEETINGMSFFEADPELFLPSAQGGFDIRFEAGSTMPVSKPLMQSKATELFDRLMPISDIVGYDPTKLADKLVRTHDVNPDELRVEGQEESADEGRKENIVQMALLENNMIKRGRLEGLNPLGTPFSTPPHTELHIAEIEAENIKTDSPEFRFLLKHTMGEMRAQAGRQEAVDAGGSQGGLPTPPPVEGSETGSAPNFNRQGKDIQPAKVQGGGEVPQQPGSRGLLAGVRNIFRR